MTADDWLHDLERSCVPMISVIRWRVAPPVNGCRWCGIDRHAHAQRHIPGHGWHSWVSPTDAQRKARLIAHRARKAPRGGEPR